MGLSKGAVKSLMSRLQKDKIAAGPLLVLQGGWPHHNLQATPSIHSPPILTACPAVAATKTEVKVGPWGGVRCGIEGKTGRSGVWALRNRLLRP